MTIHPMYCHWRFSRKMMACRPYTAPIIASAMYGSADSPVATVMMRYSMYTAVAGKMMVPSRSMNTIKRIEN